MTASLSELAISLPFKIDAIGKVGATNTPSKIWSDRVKSVIGTALGQRVYRPQFGCQASLGVFDTEEYVLSTIEADIAEAFKSFLPLLEVDSIEVTVDPDTLIISADVQYITPSGVDYSVRLGIATINGTNPIDEEFAWQIQ